MPLSKNIKTIGVIGPNADDISVIYGDTSGISSNPVTILQGIKNKLPQAEILYSQGCNYADVDPLLENITGDVLQFNNQPGLQGEYFNGIELKENR